MTIKERGNLRMVSACSSGLADYNSFGWKGECAEFKSDRKITKETIMFASRDDVNKELIEAITHKKLDVAGLLLGSGANPNARDSRGRTCLHLAVMTGDVAAVNLLLWSRANPWLWDEGTPPVVLRRAGINVLSNCDCYRPQRKLVYFGSYGRIIDGCRC